MAELESEDIEMLKGNVRNSSNVVIFVTFSVGVEQEDFGQK